MGDLYVVPLCLGHIVRDKSHFTFPLGIGEKMEFPLISWYIRGGDKNILIDTGGNTPEKAAPFHQPVLQKPEETLTAALSSIGLTPEDIDIVVNTHLHWDHCYNNNLFKKATFYVQREELRYAIAPLSLHARGYEPPSLGMIPPYIGTRFTIINGDLEIAPGVTLVLTPGHTPGSMGVLVESTAGKVFIAGDTVPLFENWTENLKLPSVVHVDLEEYERTFQKITRLKPDVILPGHDPLVFNKIQYP